MASPFIAGAAVLAGGAGASFLAKRLASKRGGRDFGQMMERTPEGSRTRWVFDNVSLYGRTPTASWNCSKANRRHPELPRLRLRRSCRSAPWRRALLRIEAISLRVPPMTPAGLGTSGIPGKNARGSENLCSPPPAGGGQLCRNPTLDSISHAAPQRAPARGSRLSAEEERDLIVATERGDGVASRQLVESFLPAIGGVARRFNAGGRVQRSELMQEGVAALLFAATRHDRAGSRHLGLRFLLGTEGHAGAGCGDDTAGRPLRRRRPSARPAQRRRREHVHSPAPSPRAPSWRPRPATAVTSRQPAGDRPDAARLRGAVGSAHGRRSHIGRHDEDPEAEHEYDHILDQVEVRDLAVHLDGARTHCVVAPLRARSAGADAEQDGARLGLTAERVRQIEADALDKLRAAAAEPRPLHPGLVDELRNGSYRKRRATA